MPTVPWSSIEHIVRPRQPSRQAVVAGRGSFGEVLRGHTDRWGMVAVKRVPPEKADSAHSEAQVLCRLAGHPNVLRLHGSCVRDGHVHLVLEFVPCGNLQEQLYRLKRGSEGNRRPWKALMPGQRVNVLLGVARAVHHMHEGAQHATILHRCANCYVSRKLHAKEE